ncbi:aldose epimerase family protein [Roseibaca sp. Y0-43]|uniref:aldose epimerase family protein n=1 Tax=Roseibaca sp. Y0-43 TaxID=2816854 RepID=UPI001D0CDC7C|nr:aldose epimerase family protein [Roseibaca sp. Y0-43]
MTIEPWGQMPDGQLVHRLHLSGGGITAHVLTLGAIVQDLRLDGVAYPLVLGAGQLAPYLGPMRYFGATVGRFANRIAGGRFTLNGVTHDLSRNTPGGHCLHGGTRGASDRIWAIEDHAPDRATLSLTLPDGDMGFPGRMEVVLQVALAEGAISFDYSATTDADTPCSLSHHGYFVLDDSGSIAEHRLRVAAERYLPVDASTLPTGEIAPVADTPFDFRSPRSLSGVALDHNFCLTGKRVPLRPVAWLDSPRSGLAMQVATTESGLQVYTANHLPEQGVTDHKGRPYARHAGIALEAQAWPDAPNRPDFPDATLRVGETYRHVTRYSFHRL